MAVVGPTGAGKTTIVKLLMRFYELNAGRITIDGHDITDLSRENLREMFGMVLQDTWLNNGTIRENIKYGNHEATDEEVEAAARAAHIDHFIKTQSKGYDMEVNEEASNISQGQKQLITIARAFLADAPILILDEATSSVDTRTEALIQKAMTPSDDGRQDELRDRPQAFHHKGRRPYPRHESRRHNRAGHARGAAGAERILH